MTTLRLILTSIALCAVFHSFHILGLAQAFAPEKAAGSLVTDAQGKIIGSRLIAQAFTSDRYFHPRPSACDYNARASSGSNLSPTNPALAARAGEIATANHATADTPIPADLVTASGSGLDPHITQAAAHFQIARVAAARRMPEQSVRRLLPSGPLVNVLELNLALDAAKP
ncbi:MAG: potassium-transporting ATPase subunit C [Verrucomicrobiota bacterium]